MIELGQAFWLWVPSIQRVVLYHRISEHKAMVNLILAERNRSWHDRDQIAGMHILLERKGDAEMHFGQRTTFLVKREHLHETFAKCSPHWNSLIVEDSMATTCIRLWNYDNIRLGAFSIRSRSVLRASILKTKAQSADNRSNPNEHSQRHPLCVQCRRTSWHTADRTRSCYIRL